MSRDDADLGKVAEKLDSFTPFAAGSSLRNIFTGIRAKEDLSNMFGEVWSSVQEFFEIGEHMVKKMDGQSVFSYSHKKV